MEYPALVRPEVCRTPIRLVIQEEGIDGDGAPREAFQAELMCNWQDGGGAEYTPERRWVSIAGRAYFPGDICPDLPVIAAGYGEIFGARRVILRGIKARNPDGTVNYTEVRFG